MTGSSQASDETPKIQIMGSRTGRDVSSRMNILIKTGRYIHLSICFQIIICKYIGLMILFQ